MKKQATLQFQFFALILSIILFINNANANNISVSNISITGQNTTAGSNNAANYSMVKFNIAWENSWRSSALNWDAAWVFVKYRVNGGAWNHCNLHNTGHTAPTGSNIDAGLVTPSSAFNATSNPAVGVFIYKNTDGNGNVNYQNVQLRWNYGSQGVTDNAILDVQVFATEMVYVPTGTFAAGDGATDANQFTLTTINTGNATTAPSSTGSLGGQAGGYPTGQSAPSSSSFPNGYNAFYCMKYEITQGQYRDFLNTLTYNQQVNRTAYPITSNVNRPALSGQYRNGLYVKIAGNSLTNSSAIFGCNLNYDTVFDDASDGEWIACNFLSRIDVLSFLDWSGLRAMSELEFEKSCRGSLLPVTHEKAWGTTLYNALYTNNIVNEGSNNEEVSANFYSSNTSTGNLIIASDGPLRAGILASNSLNNGRISSGATYYGIMEMSGNLFELSVAIDDAGFIASHGDGTLDSDGNKTNLDWSYNFINTKGSGHPNGLASSSEVSIRGCINCLSIAGRGGYLGGRGVRSAQ